jgi:hypothetical protein
MMAALIMVREGRDWQSSSALFEWTLEYLIPRMTDEKTAEWLRTIVAEDLGNLWIPDLPPEAQEEIRLLLRGGLLRAAAQAFPGGSAVEELRELVALTY